MKIGTIVLLALGILVTLPVLQNERFTDFASNGEGPVFAGSLFPFARCFPSYSSSSPAAPCRAFTP
jgi:carbon starvation protein CstA